MPQELSAPYRDAKFPEEAVSLLPMEKKQRMLSFGCYYRAPDSALFLCRGIEDPRSF